MRIIDYIVLFGYFISITTFGLWMARKIKSSDGYFRGERKFKWYIMIGQAGLVRHSDTPAVFCLFGPGWTDAGSHCCCKYVGLLKFHGQYRSTFYKKFLQKVYY